MRRVAIGCVAGGELPSNERLVVEIANDLRRGSEFALDGRRIAPERRRLDREEYSGCGGYWGNSSSESALSGGSGREKFILVEAILFVAGNE